MIPIIKKTMLLSILILSVWGCLDIQDSYDYKPSVVDPNLGMSAWEFIEHRTDTFSILKEAIEYVDQAYPGFKDYYTQDKRKYTYLFLDNAGFTGTGGVFRNTGGGVTSVDQINPAVLRNILLYHIVDGFYHSHNRDGSLNFDPIHVITLLRSQNAIMTMKISNENSRNNFSRLIVNDTAGSSTPVMAATSNLIATNGVIHVFSRQIVYLP